MEETSQVPEQKDAEQSEHRSDDEDTDEPKNIPSKEKEKKAKKTPGTPRKHGLRKMFGKLSSKAPPDGENKENAEEEKPSSDSESSGKDGSGGAAQDEIGDLPPSTQKIGRNWAKSRLLSKRSNRSRSKKNTSQEPESEINDPVTQLVQFKKEDIKGRPILMSQVPRYVRVDFQDGTGPMVEEPLLPQKAVQESSLQSAVFVESSTTGRFFKVKMGTGKERMKGLRQRLKKKRQEILERRKNNLSTMERAQEQSSKLFQVLDSCFLLIQGLLAGSSIPIMYLASTFHDMELFLTQYQTLANEVRRIMYLLSMLAFIGSTEAFMRRRADEPMWKQLSRPHRYELAGMVLCYTMALISTLICTPTDVQIMYKDYIKTSNWVPIALSRPRFLSSLRRWYLFNVIRFLTSSIGWILVCRDRHRESIKGHNSLQQASTLREELRESKERVNLLSGKFVEKLPKEEMLEILAMQKKAVEQTERTIDIQIRRELDHMYN